MKQDEINKLRNVRGELIEATRILEKYKEVVAIGDVVKAIRMYVRDGAKEDLILTELGIIGKADNLEMEKCK